jgi:hypothetical protein
MLSADFSTSASDSEQQDQGYKCHLDENGAHSLIQYLAFCQENNYYPHKKKAVIKISSVWIHWLRKSAWPADNLVFISFLVSQCMRRSQREGDV